MSRPCVPRRCAPLRGAFNLCNGRCAPVSSTENSPGAAPFRCSQRDPRRTCPDPRRTPAAHPPRALGAALWPPSKPATPIFFASGPAELWSTSLSSATPSRRRPTCAHINDWRKIHGPRKHGVLHKGARGDPAKTTDSKIAFFSRDWCAGRRGRAAEFHAHRWYAASPCLCACEPAHQ